MRKSKKTLAILTIIAMVLMMVPVQAFADNAAAPTRLAGSDRIDTAIAIANQGWANGASTVIVAPADDANLVDALAVAPVAGQLNAPILMTYKDSLDSRVQAEIGALKATKVIAVGALSTNAVSQLKAISGVTVDQVQGADRFGTASQLAAMLTNPAGTFVVAYNGLADAMSAASYAAANNYAIMIADTNGALPSSETAVGSKTYTVGGQVAAIAGATSFAGADRYATNDAVIKGLSYKYDKVYVANGETLVDALAGSALAAQTDSLIVLANTSGAAAAADVHANMTASSQVIPFGGVAVVPDSVVASISNPGTTPPAATGTVSVSTSWSPSQSIAVGQALVDVGSATFTANGGDATISAITLQRSGLSSDNAVKGITVWDGSTRLNVSSVFANGVATIGFTYPVTVKAGQSKTLAIKLNIDTDKTNKAKVGSQIVVSLTGVTASGTVNASLPSTSNVFTISDVTLGTMTSDYATDSPTTDLAPNATGVTLAKYHFTAVNEDITLKTVTLTQNGAASDTDITNLALYNGATEVAKGTLVNRVVSFDLGDGIKIANGGVLDLTLKGDMVGGAGRSVRFDINDANDVQGVGATYGTTVVGTASSTAASYTRTVDQGSLIVSMDSTSPAAATITNDAQDATFAAVKIESVGEPIQLREVVVQAVYAGGASVATDLSAFKTIKLMSNGNVIAQNTSPGLTGASATLTMSLTSPLTVTPGTPAVIDVLGTMDSAKANTGAQFRLGFDGDSGYVTDSYGMVSGKKITGTAGSGDITGNLVTIGSLSVTPAAVPASNVTVFNGTAGNNLVGFSLKDNLSEDVSLSTLDVKFYQSNRATAQNPKGDFANLQILDSTGARISNVVTSPDSATGEVTFTFDNGLTIPKGQTVQVTLAGDALATAGADTYTFGVVGAGSTARRVSNGNAVTVVDAAASTQTTAISSGTSNIQVAASSVANIDTSNNMMRNAKDVKVAQFKFSQTAGQTEAAQINKVDLVASYNYDNTIISPLTSDKWLQVQNITNIRLVDGSGNVVGTADYLNNGTATEIKLTSPLKVTTAGSAELGVLVDVSSDAKYAGTLSVALDQVKYQGASSGKTYDTGVIASVQGSPKGTAVFAVHLTDIAVSDTTTVSTVAYATGVTAGQFTLTNNGSDSAIIKNLNLTDLDGQSVGTQFQFINLNNGKVIGTATADGSDNITLAIIPANYVRVDAGSSVQIGVKVYALGPLLNNTSVMLRVVSSGTTYDNVDLGGYAYTVDNSKTLANVTLHN